jgi:hypothetical protein
MEKNVLEVLAEKHDEWIYMALSLGVCKDDANELVSGMYLKLYDYVKSVDRIMYSETEVNTFYVYKTIQNLFKTGYHLNGKKGGMLRNKVVRVQDDYFYEKMEDEFIPFENSDSEYEEDASLYTQIQEVLNTESVTNTSDLADRGNTESFFDAAFGNVVEDVKCISDTWRWYDKKMFRLHFAELYDDEARGMSMRTIAKRTNISLKSVFLTLKACKLRVREEFQADYDKWKESKKEI